MNKGKKNRLESWEKWLNKGKNRYIALCVLCVVTIAILLVSIVGNIKKMQVQGMYPDGGLTKESVEHPGYTLHKELTYKALFPYAAYSCYLPSDSKIKDNAIIGMVDGITVVAISTVEEDVVMYEERLPLFDTVPVLGAKPEVRLEIEDSGYFYDKKANYYACTVSIDISTREQITYTMCYALESEGKKDKLYLYVSTEDKEKIKDAFTLLWNVALSVSVVEDIDEALKEDFGVSNDAYIGMTQEEMDRINQEYAEKYDPNSYDLEIEQWRENGYYQIDGGYEIYVMTELDMDYENGAFYIYWSNVGVSPYELYIADKEGNRYYADAERTTAGNYVFILGKLKEGDKFYLKGTTPEMFEYCNYAFMELAGYDSIYGEDKVMVPHEG